MKWRKPPVKYLHKLIQINKSKKLLNIWTTLNLSNPYQYTDKG